MRPGTRSRLSAVVELVRIRPTSLEGALRLYACYVRAVVRYLSNPTTFRGVGLDLRGSTPVEVRCGGIVAKVRPRSEDLHYLRPGHKPSTLLWFRPVAGEHVVDVGAHVGYFTLLAAARGAQVDSIEPNPATFRALEENVRLNHLPTVRCHNVAIGREPAKVLLEVPAVYDGTSSTVPGRAKAAPALGSYTILVPQSSLDDLGLQENLIDWLLVDVEGSEESVLMGARRTLASTRRIIIEVSTGSTTEGCRALLTSAGLRVVSSFRQSENTEYWLAERPQEAVGKVGRIQGDRREFALSQNV